MPCIKVLRSLLLSAFILLNGYGNIQEPQAEVSDSSEWITPSGSIDLTGMEIYWQNEITLEVGETALVSIYVDAVKNEGGEFSFDDGQQWLLLFETSAGDYPLFPRQYVQLGEVSCDVFRDREDALHVLVSVKQTADIRIYDCVYDEGTKGFKVNNVYNEPGINLMMSSPYSF